MLNRVRLAFRTFHRNRQKFNGQEIKDSISAFEVAIENPKYPLALIAREGFWAGLQTTFKVLMGNHYASQHTDKTYKGLLDLLMLPLASRLLMDYAYQRDNNLAARCVAGFFAYPFEAIRIIFGILLTLVLSCVVISVYAYANFKIQPKKQKKAVAQILVQHTEIWKIEQKARNAQIESKDQDTSLCGQYRFYLIPKETKIQLDAVDMRMIVLQAQNKIGNVIVSWLNKGKIVSKEIKLVGISQEQLDVLSKHLEELVLNFKADEEHECPYVRIETSNRILQDDVLLQCGFPYLEELVFFSDTEDLLHKQNWFMNLVDEKEDDMVLGVKTERADAPFATIELNAENEAGIKGILNLNMFHIAQTLREQKKSNCVEKWLEKRSTARTNVTDALAAVMPRELLHLTLFYAGYANREQKQTVEKLCRGEDSNLHRVSPTST